VALVLGLPLFARASEERAGERRRPIKTALLSPYPLLHPNGREGEELGD
jgi:hypothetical protein